MTGPSDFTLFLGRFHPLLVHLPIGLIVLLAALEVLSLFPRFKHASVSTGFIVAMAAPLSIVTVGLGWLLSLAGGYDDRLLQWHKWTGVGTAAACLVAALLYGLNLRKSYRLCLAVTVVSLTVASHYGGSLTHGSDYLVRYAPEPVRAWLGSPRAKPVAVEVKTRSPVERAAYASLIHPILDDKCVSCHGPEKAKGGLRLDSFEALMKGGDSGPTVVAGKQAESDLVRRVRLPVDDEDHMPPEGKPQLHADDVALLAWWIDSGASEQKTVAELKPSPRIAEIIATRLGAPVPAAPSGAETAPPKPLHEVVPVAETLGGELGIPIVPLSQAEPWLQVNAGIAAASFGDEQLLKLKAIGLNLRWLDLAGTKVTDAGLAHLAAMPNLVRLHLQRTAVSDDGLAQLASLGNLEYLNLYGTAVSDAGLDQLKALPKLRQVYLWQSKVTPTAARAFAEGRIDQAQVRGWQEQIEQLQAKIRNSKIVVDTGNMTVVVPAVSSGSLNRECPVSGRTADRSKTITYEGRLVAFCCDDCKAKFQQDPKLYLSKLPPISPAAEHKPVNAKCPVSDKDVDPAKTITYEGRLVAFCCDDCKAKFQQDPKSYLDKLPPASASTDAKPK